MMMMRCNCCAPATKSKSDGGIIAAYVICTQANHPIFYIIKRNE